MKHDCKDARRITDDLFSAWRAVRNVIELEDAGLYPVPLPEGVRAMLRRCASELSMAMAEQSALDAGEQSALDAVGGAE